MRSDKEQKLMQMDAYAALEQLHIGKSAWKVSEEMLERVLPEKDAALSSVMLNRIERTVSRFEKMKERAFAQPDGWLNAQIDEMNEGKEALEPQLKHALVDVLEGESLSLEGLQQLSQLSPAQYVEGFEQINAHDRCVVLSALTCAQDVSVQPEIAAAAVCYADSAQEVLHKYDQAQAPAWLHVVAQCAVCAALVGLYILAESVLLPLVIPTGMLAVEQSIMNVLRLGIILSYVHWGWQKVDGVVDDLWNICRKNKEKAAVAQKDIEEMQAQLEVEQVQHNLIYE